MLLFFLLFFFFLKFKIVLIRYVFFCFWWKKKCWSTKNIIVLVITKDRNKMRSKLSKQLFIKLTKLTNCAPEHFRRSIRSLLQCNLSVCYLELHCSPMAIVIDRVLMYTFSTRMCVDCWFFVIQMICINVSFANCTTKMLLSQSRWLSLWRMQRQYVQWPHYISITIIQKKKIILGSIIHWAWRYNYVVYTRRRTYIVDRYKIT